MAEEIGFENGRNSNFQGLVTLTLDPVIRLTVVHHSSTSTYIPNFIQIEETFCGRTDGRTDGHFFPSLILLGRFLEVDLKTHQIKTNYSYIVDISVSITDVHLCKKLVPASFSDGGL